MEIINLIKKKRNKKSLSQEELNFIIDSITSRKITDYQIASLLMAIYLNGMSSIETSNLTMAMIYSGKQIDLAKIKGVKIDKHSTGGIGDKITLIVCPLVASLGIKVPLIAGRALDFTGGTIDKLESIPNFNTKLTEQQFLQNLDSINIAIMEQTDKIVPADKYLYALRDKTATVESIPLIASSIMSKKLVVSSDGIVIDLKVGSGAFIDNLKDARKLALLMIKIGKNLHRKVSILITNMDQPLGNMIGNSLEIIEAIEVLKGKGPQDLKELSLEIGALMLILSKQEKNYNLAKEKINQAILNSQGLNKLREMIKFQNGDANIIDNYNLLPKACYRKEIIALCSGFVQKINGKEIGRSLNLLGAGRTELFGKIDHSVGLIIKKKIGDKVKKGDILSVLEFNDKEKLETIISNIQSAYQIGKQKPKSYQLILEKL